jgi:hypothetical protein
MNAKRPIKIIKRDRSDNADLVPVDALTEFDAAERKEQRVSAVNNWISERRENDRLEKANSETAMEHWRKNLSTAG